MLLTLNLLRCRRYTLSWGDLITIKVHETVTIDAKATATTTSAVCVHRYRVNWHNNSVKVLIYNYCRTQNGIKLHWFYSRGRLYNFDARVTPAVKVIIKLVRRQRATLNIYIYFVTYIHSKR